MVRKRCSIVMVSLLTTGIVLCLAGPLLPGAASASDLRIYVNDVGQGDGMQVVFPDSTSMSIDCASASIRTISHFHQDHCGNPAPPGSITRNGVIPGDVIYSGDGVTVTCLASNGRVLGETPIPYRERKSSSENNWSMALLISYGGFDYLTAGDLGGSVENRLGDVLVSMGEGVDVLKVSHHGSRYSSSSSFLSSVMPEASVISVGNNGYGHPTQDTLDRLYAVNSRIYQTGRGDTGYYEDVTVANGTVLITTDGFTYTIQGLGSTPFYDGPYSADEYVGPTLTPTTTPTITPTPTPLAPLTVPPHLLITEVAVDDYSPEDHAWFELYLPPGAAPVDLSTLCWDGDGSEWFATNGPLTLSIGDVVIVHDTTGTDESDATGKGPNGWWDVYIDYNDWDIGDGQFLITTHFESPGGIDKIDAVIWSDDDGYMPSGKVNNGNSLIAYLHWGDPIAGAGSFATGDEGPAIGDINDGYARRVDTEDTNSVSDWTIAPGHSQGTPPPMAPIRVNFQPVSSRIPAGYVVDDGSGYESIAGYGWQ